MYFCVTPIARNGIKKILISVQPKAKQISTIFDLGFLYILFMATKKINTSAPSHGSSTIIINEVPTENDPPKIQITLKRKPKKNVKWSSNTVDNEGLGKKSSKSEFFILILLSLDLILIFFGQ